MLHLIIELKYNLSSSRIQIYLFRQFWLTENAEELLR